MFHNLLSSRLIQVGIVFFFLVVGGSLLYNWHVRLNVDSGLHPKRFPANSPENHPVANDPETGGRLVVESVVDTRTQAEGGARAQTSADFSNPVASDLHLFETPTGPRTFAELTPAQQRAAMDQFYRDRGLEPPEPGYTYYFDEQGRAHYHKEYEPIVKIETQIGFAPTLVQYERYQQLQGLLETAKTEGDTAKILQLSTEIDRLKQDAQGEIPTGASVVTFGAPDESIESAKQRGVQKAAEQLDKAYAERNLQHLRTEF